jgi:hypothetical protein
MKTKEIAISKSQQKRIAIQSEPKGKKGEKPPKNPRVPIYPPNVVPLVNHLNKIIDDEANGDQEKRALAYGLLTRLAVVWTQPPADWPKVQVDFVVETGLLHFNSELIRDMVDIMNKLFPNGEGLPAIEGFGPL